MLLGKLGQRFNLSGIISTFDVVLKTPQLALPHLEASDTRSIDWTSLKHLGFQGVVLDKDNTLTAPYKITLWPSLAASIDDCKTVFDGRVAILSNSAGLHQYDPQGVEAESLELALGIPVIRHGSKKPSGSVRELEEHFGCDASTLIMVGDRYLTDIVYGNRNGLLTIITRPLTQEGEPIIVRVIRKLEKVLVRRLQNKGVMPPTHKLMRWNGNSLLKNDKQ